MCAGFARLLRAAPLLLLLPGCQGWQSALDPHGPGARSLADLFWLFFWVSAVVWTLVMLALVGAVARRRLLGPDPLSVEPRQESRARWVVGAAVAATGAVILLLTGFSYSAQTIVTQPQPDELVIRVTGRQWWWDVRYEDAETDRVFTTANEIHVPVGRPVRLTLMSDDVIHSFWVPSLTGKMDLIPGRQNELRLRADRAGVYRGQCAEFCGYQHAHMGVFVIADTPEDFEAWRNGQIASAALPVGPEAAEGLAVFQSQACVMCHAIRGTLAGSRAGPDLTHVGSRRTIAAGTLPTTRGNLAAWIIDPQGVKPGAKMPTIKLNPQQVNALSAYLEGLR